MKETDVEDAGMMEAGLQDERILQDILVLCISIASNTTHKFKTYSLTFKHELDNSIFSPIYSGGKINPIVVPLVESYQVHYQDSSGADAMKNIDLYRANIHWTIAIDDEKK